MSNRLTNDMRGKIVNAVLEHKFNPIIAELAKDFAALADDVHKTAFRKILEKIEALPEGWLPTDDDIQVEFGAGKMQRLNFNGQFTHRYGYRVIDGVHVSEADLNTFAQFPPATFRRFPANKKGTCVSSFDARSELSLRYDELSNRKYDLISSFNKARLETGVAVSKFTTIDKLLEAWPEIEPFTKGVAAKAKPQLPAVPIMKLNELLGLPAEETA